MLSRLSSFAARRSELVDCYKSFCVCIDDSFDDDDDVTCSKQAVPVNGNDINDSTKSNDAELVDNSIDKTFNVICKYVDEIH